MFEKIGSERNYYSDEVERNKEYINKLEVHIGQLEDSQSLMDRIGKQHIAYQSLELDFEQVKRIVKDKDDQIEKLTYENETLKRAIDVQIQFEGRVYPQSNNRSGGIGREAMRALYFELGKKQADSHGLSLSLAQCNQDLENVREDANRAACALKEMEAETESLRSYNNILAKQSVHDREEISTLSSKVKYLSEVLFNGKNIFTIL